MTKEALKLALEWYDSGNEDRNKFQIMIESILAQPAQEPVDEAAIRADEREACAKVCEQPIDEIQITDTISEVVYMDAHECAAGIRARGNT